MLVMRLNSDTAHHQRTCENQQASIISESVNVPLVYATVGLHQVTVFTLFTTSQSQVITKHVTR